MKRINGFCEPNMCGDDEVAVTTQTTMKAIRLALLESNYPPDHEALA